MQTNIPRSLQVAESFTAASTQLWTEKEDSCFLAFSKRE